MLSFYRAMSGKTALRRKLLKHFGDIPLHNVVSASHNFPSAARVDVQAALHDRFSQDKSAELLGIHSQVGHETATLAHMLSPGPFSIDIGPLQNDEIDIGEFAPIRCLKNALWLSKKDNVPFAVVMTPSMNFGQCGGIHVEVGVSSGEAGMQFSNDFLRDVEKSVGLGKTYRGKVISLEATMQYSGLGGSVKVHRLRTVKREEVILPPKTVTLLDRNVITFLRARDHIKSLGMSGKKGLLLYGPPGTGKTHTIHYLASQLIGHTTLLITAEQVGLIDEYFRLARFLQPSIVVIEDVDLIAREREHAHSPIQEVLLNKLLNEMDGLREDADVLFILTTNRPDLLEPALASRPGRIDQAIEFPLPDEDGRKALVRLYSRGATIQQELVDTIASKTKGASAAFIKELMRRSAQFHYEANTNGSLQLQYVDAALEEMLFIGGTLNAKLLGGVGIESVETRVRGQA